MGNIWCLSVEKFENTLFTTYSSLSLLILDGVSWAWLWPVPVLIDMPGIERKHQESCLGSLMVFLGALLVSFICIPPNPPTKDFQWILGPDVAGGVGKTILRRVRVSALGFGSSTDSDGIKIVVWACRTEADAQSGWHQRLALSAQEGPLLVNCPFPWSREPGARHREVLLMFSGWIEDVWTDTGMGDYVRGFCTHRLFWLALGVQVGISSFNGHLHYMFHRHLTLNISKTRLIINPFPPHFFFFILSSLKLPLLPQLYKRIVSESRTSLTFQTGKQVLIDATSKRVSCTPPFLPPPLCCPCSGSS